MQPPKEHEWLVAEGIQGMQLMPVLVLTVGQEISEGKWSFGGYKIYPGAIHYVNAYLYASRQLAQADTDESPTATKCWREVNPVNELVNDLIIALAKFQASM